MTNDKHSPEPSWYRQFWPWFLITFPLTAVVAGLFTLYLAIISDDGLVADDYYKRGLAINTDLGRYQRAKDLGLWAEIEFILPAAARAESAAVRVRLHSSRVDDVPQLAMQLSLVHPTQPGRDQRVKLQPAGDGSYRADIVAPGPGSWHINLDSAGGDWRLTGRAHPGQQAQVTLTAE